jgi:membrane protein
VWRFGKTMTAAGRMLLRHEVPRDAAGISYFTIMALFPAILVVIAAVDAFLGKMEWHDMVVESIVGLFPGSRQFVRSNLAEVTTPSKAGIISCIVVVFWAASWIFSFIENSINRAWDIPNQRTFWESRLRTIALLALASVSLFCSAGLTIFVGMARARAAEHIHLDGYATASEFIGWFWYLVLLGTGILVAVFVFSMVYKWTPHCKVFWREAFTSAVVATAIWEVAGYIFMKVVPLFDYQQVYGRMGATVTLLAWVYTSNMILLFGANFCSQLHWIRAEMPGPEFFPDK